MDVRQEDEDTRQDKKDTPNCRIILFVDDESDSELTEKVRQAKREGLIDAFLFGSVSENYFRRNSSWHRKL